MSQNRADLNLDNRIDYGILLPVFVLILMGLAALYGALSQNPLVTDVTSAMLKQVLWILIGAVAVIVMMQFSSRLLWRLTPLFYALGLGVMTLLIWFHDAALEQVTGSKNWFNFNGIMFQPSELMKIAYILMLAFVVTRHNMVNEHTVKNDRNLIVKLFLVTLPIIILIKFQQDLGTMLVYVAILGGVFLMSGISWRIIIPCLVVFSVLAIGTIYLVTTDTGRQFLSNVGVKDYQLSRIDSWQDPFHDPTGTSLQQAQALTAVGSGGVLGKGFNVSDVQVPVRESDMIFTVTAENFGFIGGALMILMYFVLIYRMIRVCFDTNNEFYAYISTGIIMMILFHVFENIGANIGLLPLTGIPLPFVSQGGSALLGNMIGVGIVLSMRYQKPTL